MPETLSKPMRKVLGSTRKVRGFQRHRLLAAQREDYGVIEDGILDRLVGGFRDGIQHIRQTNIGERQG